jgi:hypothetical protein
VKRAGAAAAALLLCAAARAELAQFDAGPIPPNGALYSADGYHYAYLQSDAREDRWIVDGRARIRGKAGELSAPGALSSDGSVLFHFLAVPGGWAPAVNGRRIGQAVYSDVGEIQLSRSGRNAAFCAQTPQGWVVVSGQGTGPAFEKPPLLLAVSEKSTAYVVVWSGAQWYYRDHQAVRSVPYDRMSFSAELLHFGGVWKASDNRFYVEVDGASSGPLYGASAPVFSPNGRRVGYLAGDDPNDYGGTSYAVVDGIKQAVKPCRGCALILDDAGRTFEDKTLFLVDEKAQLHSYSLDGKELGKAPALGASAGRYGLTILGADSRGLGFAVDGHIVEPDAPLALAVSPPVFDGPREYHYWSLSGQNLHLACGSTEGGDPRSTRCAAVAQRLGWERASDAAPPASPVSAP